jgi:hypothetical protein
MMEENVCSMVVATNSMAENLNATARYVAALLGRAANIKDSKGETKYPEFGPQSCGLYSTFPSGVSGPSGPSGSSVARAMYKYVNADDGVTRETWMNPKTAKIFQEAYAAGKPIGGHVLLSFQKMAAGGLITEPIFGIGQNTGKGYLMGEAGPERITPGTGPAPGGTISPTFNITINASGIGDIERELKPAILRMLKESTSRAGIV